MSWAQFEDVAEAKGYAQISNALLRSPHVSLQAKGFYALLKSYAWEDPSAFPGIKRLRRDTGASDNTLKKYRDELTEVGLLKVVRRGRGQTNLYVFKSITKFLESHTGAKQESHMGDDLESHTGANNEDAVNEDSEDKSTDSSENAKVESLANYHMKRIYDSMKKANYTITGKSKNGNGENEYGRLVSRVQWMLDNMSPTDEELEGLPDSYVRAYTIRGAATDAVYALNELRRQKARDEVMSETKPAAWEPVNPASTEALKAKEKPRNPIWYASVYEADFDTVSRWVDEGATHSEIETRLAGAA